jgi:hypothetical protein
MPQSLPPLCLELLLSQKSDQRFDLQEFLMTKTAKKALRRRLVPQPLLIRMKNQLLKLQQ